MKKTLALLAVAASTIAAPALAQRSVSGNWNGNNFEARSTIVGAGSTFTVAAGGNPDYLGDYPRHSGVVQLVMNFGAAGSFVCSGSLLNDRRSIATAAHCMTNGPGLAKPQSVIARFYPGPGDAFLPGNPAGLVTLDVTKVFVNADYTGQVIDQNDIAVVRLGQEAPAFATSYSLSSLNSLTGQEFNVAGYGLRSGGGGNVGTADPAQTGGTGRLREGDNRFDFNLGDAQWDDFWNDFWATRDDADFANANVNGVYLTDFDNGLGAQDASCRIAAAFGLGGAQFCNLGLGAREVNTAGGDSGGPQFINGELAGVTSFGLSFGANFGDIRAGLNSSFGEFGGYVPIYLHRDFIARAGVVPEPATWAMMIAGFGLVGAGYRRRRTAAKIAIA